MMAMFQDSRQQWGKEAIPIFHEFKQQMVICFQWKFLKIKILNFWDHCEFKADTSF